MMPEPIEDLRGDPSEVVKRREGLRHELHREISPGHVLQGADVRVVAHCRACDDIIVELPDGWAVVHLTYASSERPPWPRTDHHDTLESALEAAAEPHAPWS